MLPKKLCTRLVCMTKKTGTTDPIAWFSEMIHQRVTVTRIGQILGVSRNTARSRIDDGLAADDVVTIARALSINPILALQELGYVTPEELFDALDSDGTLLASASPSQLVERLAEDVLSPEQKLNLSQSVIESTRRASITPIDSARSNTPTPGVADGAYTDGTMPEDAVAKDGKEWGQPDDDDY